MQFPARSYLRAALAAANDKTAIYCGHQIHSAEHNNISDITEGDAVNRTSLLRVVAVMSGLCSIPAHGAQNDQLPTDLVALPDGSINVAVYAAHQSLAGPWMDGAKLRSGEGSTTVGALRINRHYAFGENDKYSIAPVLGLTTVSTEADARLVVPAGRESSGFGDLRLGAVFWFHKDDVNREYANASVFFSLPTGDYEPTKAVNVGENRVKTIMSMGWLRPLGSRWVLELIPEVAIFGDNTRFLGNRRLSQDVAYAMTGMLRYKATPTLHWYTSAQLNRGGETQLDGVRRTGAPDNTRLYLGTILFGSNNHMLQLRYSRDVQIENGFRNTGEMAIRWSTYFK